MDFEIGHLDMLTTEHEAPHSYSNPPSSSPTTPTASQSLILNELHKETEELQNKLKLNQRRLLLFETENNKLLEEKNKLFFEMKNLAERNKILLEKNSHLEEENNVFEEQMALLHEKNQSFEQINKTQLIEIKRFTKFHNKIQNVIKPYLHQLKTQVQTLSEELTRAQNNIEQLQSVNADLNKKLNHQHDYWTNQVSSLETDRAQTISSYEEQIHTFSKEIIRMEQVIEDHRNEIGRLKKNVEFKNYYENEVIKFKRVHETDQREILDLKEKLSWLTVQMADKEQVALSAQEKQNSAEIQLQNLEQILEATRTQLAKQIDHSEALSERLNRLEKLNLNLSQQMRPQP